MSYLLDTNIVTAFIKRNAQVLTQLQAAQDDSQDVFIRCITYYETRRGLLYTNATRQTTIFELLRLNADILLLDDLNILEVAANIHSDFKRRGKTIQDADILIAATAIVHDLILVSNDSDMVNLQNLQLENWLADR
jgi:tRNA(fMet)-specific endonuclease VapC